MDKRSAGPRRLAGVAAVGLLTALLAGCEDRISDEIGVPRARPDRTLYAPPKLQPRPVLPAAAPYAYRVDPFRSNCAPSRC